jgi:type I restriction enzyme S subunit
MEKQPRKEASEMLLGHFANLVETDGAVGKLRELILQLAIRGLVVRQSPQDEPSASAAEESRKLAKLKFPPIAEGSLPFVLPKNWSSLRIGEAMRLINGRAFKPSDWSTAGVPIIRIQNLNKETAAFNYCESKVEEKHLVHDDDLLISWSGTPGTSFGAFIWKRGLAVLNQHIFRTEVLCEAYDKEFLKLAINGRLDEMIAKAHGAVGLQHITKGKLELLALPLPPLAEQKRIVAKVEELMALCDELETRQTKARECRSFVTRSALDHLTKTRDEPDFQNRLAFILHNSPLVLEDVDSLRKSVLALGFQGNFAKAQAGCITGGGATDVLSQAGKVRRKFWEQRYGPKRRYREPEAYEPKDLPRIPGHWKWASIDSVCAQVTDGEHIQPPYQAEGVPMLSAKHVRDDHVTLKGAGLISQEAFQKSIERCQPENGDILIVSVGATTGRCAIVEDCPRFAIVRSVLLLKPAILNKYLLWWLKNPWGFIWMTQASGASAQPHLYIRDLKHMPVPIPPLSEQRRIVAKVDDLMRLCDGLEDQIQTAQTCGTYLLDSIASQILRERV